MLKTGFGILGAFLMVAPAWADDPSGAVPVVAAPSSPARCGVVQPGSQPAPDIARLPDASPICAAVSTVWVGTFVKTADGKEFWINPDGTKSRLKP